MRESGQPSLSAKGPLFPDIARLCAGYGGKRAGYGCLKTVKQPQKVLTRWRSSVPPSRASRLPLARDGLRMYVNTPTTIRSRSACEQAAPLLNRSAPESWRPRPNKRRRRIVLGINSVAVSLSTSTFCVSLAHSAILGGSAGLVRPLALAQPFRSAAAMCGVGWPKFATETQNSRPPQGVRPRPPRQ